MSEASGGLCTGAGQPRLVYSPHCHTQRTVHKVGHRQAAALRKVTCRLARVSRRLGSGYTKCALEIVVLAVRAKGQHLTMFTRLIPDRATMNYLNPTRGHAVHDDMDPTQPRDGAPQPEWCAFFRYCARCAPLRWFASPCGPECPPPSTVLSMPWITLLRTSFAVFIARAALSLMPWRLAPTPSRDVREPTK